MIEKIVINSFGNIGFYNENDEFHRLDGPAIEWKDGSKAWYIHGKHYTEEDFNKRVGELC